MPNSLSLFLVSVAGLFLSTHSLRSQEKSKTSITPEVSIAESTLKNSTSTNIAACDRLEDIIYGRRDGHALTMDVFTPKSKKNNAGVLLVVSGEFRSNREMLALIHPMGTKPLLARGYTVFAVMHSSQPKYTVPDAIEDVRRAVRHVRANAARYGIDRDKIAIGGHSAGGHLSLMLGCDPKPGDLTSSDLVERESSKVQAVGCFCPPTDFLVVSKCPKELAAAFDFKELDQSTGKFAPVNQVRGLAIAKEISPINHVKKGGTPVLIIHGDADEVIPISQSESFIKKMEMNQVECKMITKEGKEHLWFGMDKDVESIAEWFDKHLLTK